MPAEIIRSQQNARVKHLRQAFARPGRDGLALIEGENLLREAQRGRAALHEIFVREDTLEKFRSLLAELDGSVPIHVLASEVFDSAAATEAPQGIAAFVQIPEHDATAVLAEQSALVVVLDGVQDPGNVGTILRSAEAFAASTVIALPGSASFWNLKTIRASAGSVFRVPTFAMTEEQAFEALVLHSFRIMATVARGGVAAETIDWTGNVALLIGSEGRGLSPEWIERATQLVTLAMPGAVESLNAAVATSLLLYEISKQKAAEKKRGRQ